MRRHGCAVVILLIALFTACGGIETSTEVSSGRVSLSQSPTSTGPSDVASTSIPTDVDLLAPSQISIPPCNDTSVEAAECAAGFVLDGDFYALSCGAVRDSLVTSQVIGTGEFQGRDVTVNLIEDLDRNVMVAVSVPGGDCSANDPDEVHTNWSMMFPIGPEGSPVNDEIVEAAICAVGEFSPQRSSANSCDN